MTRFIWPLLDNAHFCKTFPNVDLDAFRRAMLGNTRDNAHRNNVVHAVATLSAVDQGALHRFRAVDSDLCVFCGQCLSSLDHCIWECSHPQLVQARLEVEHPDGNHIIDHHRPLAKAMLYGIPPKMALRPKGPWWNNTPISALKDSTVHPRERALFGMSDQHDDTDPFMRWLSPHEHLDS